MFSPHRLDHRDSSPKRDLSLWHLCAIYGLLTLCIVMGMLSLVAVHHLNRRQTNVEMKLGISSSSSSSGCLYFDTHHSVIDKTREPDSEYQVEDLLEEDEYERETLTSDSGSGSTDPSNNRVLGVPESGKGSPSGAGWRKSSRDTDPSNSALSWENSEDARERNSVELHSEHQTPEEELTSVPKGLSSTSESSATNLSRGGLRTRVSREVRDREGDTERINVRTQGNKKNHSKSKNRRVRQQQLKHENESRLQGMAAIHLQAPAHMDRQYESGPMVSLNASNTRDTVYRFWRKASWVHDSAADVFHLDEVTGHVTVEVEGLYMVYAQMVYHDLSGRWSFGVYVGDKEKVKCLATEQLRDLQSYHPTSHGVYQSCYTSLVLHIRKNQSVSIRCMYGSRTILTRPEFTFWGMVRLS